MQPLVSVLMPIYNSEVYIVAAVQSILQQTYSNFELLLLDDGSTDNSLALVQAISDSRIRIITDGKNLRQPQRYNQGVALAHGKYIAIMHADDIALPERLDWQVKALEQKPEYDLVGSLAYVTYGERSSNRKIGVMGMGEYLRLYTLFNCPFLHPTLLFRKEVLEQHPYRLDYTTAEDYELWARILAQHQAVNLPIPLLRVRIHAQKNAKRHKQQQLLNVQMIVQNQLEALGLTYLAAWENCTKWVSNSYLEALTIPQLNEVAQYLLAIQNALLNSQQFPPHIVQKCVQDTWVRVCMKSSSNGIATLKTYFNSSLANKNLVVGSKLLAKCLFRI